MKPAATTAVCLPAALLLAATLAGADAAATRATVHPGRAKQTILGLGFEIQADSIGTGNHGLPGHRVAVPHDLVPSERVRLAREMLAGFRYCRLAGGLFWRGLDAEQKQLCPRWPGQLDELRALLDDAGIEGAAFEYWSPAPYWKANRDYRSAGRDDTTNVLRCFGPRFADDPDYRGDTARFLADFAGAVVNDIRSLQAAGIRVSMWGLQNEPWLSHGSAFSTCGYPDAAAYVKTWRAVAGAVRRHDPRILLFADTERDFPRKIAAGMGDPEIARLVDAYAVHTIGADSEQVRRVHKKIRAGLPPRPWFQNEYEYLTGGATPARCLNTVQHIMNSFQLAENPVWFWLHALKPWKNAEASGYSLGFWQPSGEPAGAGAGEPRRRWRDGPRFTALPPGFENYEMVSATRGDPQNPGQPYEFIVNQSVTVFLVVENTGNTNDNTAATGAAVLPKGWEPTDLKIECETTVDGIIADTIFRRDFPAGTIKIPAHKGRVAAAGGRHGAPHTAFVRPSAPATFSAQVGVNQPILIRSEYLALARAAAGLKPGHWMFNPHNWHAVGSFVKRLPWDSVVLDIEESAASPDARLLAFRRPDGKLTVVLSNRTAAPRKFEIEIAGADANANAAPRAWRGFRYTPDDAGAGALGVPAGVGAGDRLAPVLPPLSWEFWEEQP